MLPNHMKQKKRFGPGTGKFRLTAKTAPAILISDLHLTPESPETLAYFHRFLQDPSEILTACMFSETYSNTGSVTTQVKRLATLQSRML